MTNIRKGTQKHRKLLIIVVIILGAGMVSTFATWNSNYGASSSSDDPTTTDYIEMYEGAIKDNTPAEGQQIDYSTASTLAQDYKYLSSYYNKASDENKSTDEDLANQYLTKSTESITKAAEYYQLAIDNAPENLNNLGLAQLYANKAAALFSVGTASEEVRADYQKAYALAPDNWDIAYSYSQFILVNDGLEKATAFLTEYKSSLPEGSTTGTTVDQVIEYYKSLSQSDDSTESQDNTTSGDTSSGTDSTSN